MTRERNWGAKSGVTLGVWEEDAQGEVVEVGPSGEEVGLGGACPASWTCLAMTLGSQWDWQMGNEWRLSG